jgi:glycosyltransferase involved in cell wall biosynthesis
MRRDSAAILVGSKHVRSEVPRWAQSKCVYIPENGIDPLRFSVTRSRSASLPLQAAFVGRLVPLKCVDVLLEAAAEFLRAGVLQLHIVGDGPQRALLESMADRLGVRSNIVFRGWVPHAEVQKILQDCDFLALPSVREFGGGVVLESMALGVTPIVADYGGPAELVDDKTGIRVKFDDKASLVAGFARTIADLIRAPQVLDRLGSAGIQKVRRTLTWEAKANQILSVYNAVLSGQRDLTSLSYN